MTTFDPIDVFVGGKLRARRTMIGMSQESLGQAVGVTFQQIQKYERGTNRIVVSRLYQFGKALNVPLTYFFDGLEEVLNPQHTVVREERSSFEIEPLITKSTIDLLKRFSTIDDPSKRKIVTDLVRTFSQENNEDTISAAS